MKFDIKSTLWRTIEQKKTYVGKEEKKKFTSGVVLNCDHWTALNQIELNYKQQSNPTDIQWTELIPRVYYVVREDCADDKH